MMQRTKSGFRRANPRGAVVVLLLSILGARQNVAHAVEIAKDQALVSEGIELRRAGQDLEALPKFEEAYRLSASPRNAAQWGLCLNAVGRWSEADVRISEALKAKTDPWIAKNRAVLKESLEQAKQKVARVEVYGGPEGASVSINGRTVGTYPLSGPVAVNAGTVDIEVTKAGSKRAFRSLLITGGQYQRLLIRLEEGEAAPKAVALAPNALTAIAPSETKPAENTVMERTEVPSSASTPVYMVLGGRGHCCCGRGVGFGPFWRRRQHVADDR